VVLKVSDADQLSDFDSVLPHPRKARKRQQATRCEAPLRLSWKCCQPPLNGWANTRQRGSLPEKPLTSVWPLKGHTLLRKYYLSKLLADSSFECGWHELELAIGTYIGTSKKFAKELPTLCRSAIAVALSLLWISRLIAYNWSLAVWPVPSSASLTGQITDPQSQVVSGVAFKQ